MLTMFRLIVFLLLPFAVAFGQENPLPLPAPVASPESMGAGSAPIAEGEVVPSPTPAPDATPPPDTAVDVVAPEAGVPIAPEPTPSSAPVAPGDDVIPLPTDGGAPLDTQPIVPDEPDSAFVDPNAIMPDMPPAMPAAVDNRAEKIRLETIRYTQVRTQAEKDPKVESLKKQADQAKSDEEKRAAMREYYRLLFKKMVAMDKTLEVKCKNMEEAYLRRLAQTRVEPTIPLNPPPTPEPIN